MAKYSTPTKSNLINARNSLKMATQGYDMLDLKRKLLMRELAKQADQEKKIQKELRDTLAAAEAALRESNVRMDWTGWRRSLRVFRRSTISTLNFTALWEWRFLWYAGIRGRSGSRT